MISDRERIVIDVSNWIENSGISPQHRACLYWSTILCKRLHEEGIKSIIQAGSMNWPIIDPRNDDGVSPTHYSYEYTECTPLDIIRSLSASILPEMHVWVGVPETNEIIDLTTKYFMCNCSEISGLEWKSKPPPPYLWANELPDNVYYTPNPQACMIAHKLAIDWLVSLDKPITFKR